MILLLRPREAGDSQKRTTFAESAALGDGTAGACNTDSCYAADFVVHDIYCRVIGKHSCGTVFQPAILDGVSVVRRIVIDAGSGIPDAEPLDRSSARGIVEAQGRRLPIACADHTVTCVGRAARVDDSFANRVIVPRGQRGHPCCRRAESA